MTIYRKERERVQCIRTGCAWEIKKFTLLMLMMLMILGGTNDVSKSIKDVFLRLLSEIA